MRLYEEMEMRRDKRKGVDLPSLMIFAAVMILLAWGIMEGIARTERITQEDLLTKGQKVELYRSGPRQLSDIKED